MPHFQQAAENHFQPDKWSWANGSTNPLWQFHFELEPPRLPGASDPNPVAPLAASPPHRSSARTDTPRPPAPANAIIRQRWSLGASDVYDRELPNKGLRGTFDNGWGEPIRLKNERQNRGAPPAVFNKPIAIWK